MDQEEIESEGEEEEEEAEVDDVKFRLAVVSDSF